MKNGRPTLYKEEYNELAYKYCLLGADDVRLGKFFGVSEKTINAWKKKHPEFLLSLKKGKDIADAEIAESLYRRAKGYEFDEVSVKQMEGGIVHVTKTKKHIHADTAAAFIWLKNRQHEYWRDKPEEADQQVSGRLVNYKRISGNDNRN